MMVTDYHGVMYLARVVIGKQPVVHEVNDYEFVLTSMTNMNINSVVHKVKRAPDSWTINCFGHPGAAAIGFTPGAAIGAAKVMLEMMLMRSAEQKAKEVYANPSIR